MTVYPGLIDSETHLGLTEISAVQSTNDLVETSDEIMPHMHVADAFHAETELIPTTRVNGITNAIVAPASQDTLPGQDSFIQLAGPSADEMLMVRDIAMPLNFGPGAAPQDGLGNRPRHLSDHAHGHGRATPPGVSRRARLPAEGRRLREAQGRKGRATGEARPETGGAASLPGGQEADRARGQRCQRPGNRGQAGQRISPEIHSEPRHPLAGGAGLHRAAEGAGHRRSHLRLPQGQRALRRGVQPAGRTGEARREDRIRLL